MATVAFSTLLNEVLPYVADCPPVLAEHALRNASIEFCHKTQLWTYDVAAINIVASTASYTPTLPTETVLVEIQQAWREGFELKARSADELTRLYSQYDWRTETGSPLYHFREVPSQIRLVLTPNTSITAGLTMRVALSPTRAGTLLDSEIAERFAELIGNGARARLHATAGQPFFNPAEAARMERRFNSGITDARIKANRGYARATAQVAFNGGFL